MNTEISDYLKWLDSDDENDLFDKMTDLGKRIVLSTTEKDLLKKEIEKHLTSNSAIAREVAIKVLTFYWCLPEYREKAMEMFLTDMDEDVKTTALMGWANTHRNSDNKQVIEFLISILSNNLNSKGLREQAFGSIFVVSKLQPPDWPKTSLDWDNFESEINWDLINKVLEEAK